jgi:fused signal recognition particle receptor
LAAADTFRAAAIEQLEIHANKIGIPIIKKEYNSDPASVGFEAIAYAKKHAIDVVLIDTAGRMNTKESLMKEMSEEVAMEYFEYNTRGAYVGENTPAFLFTFKH